MQQGDSLIAMPIYMPKDSAIPAPEVPAKASFTRAFLRDKKVLQREQKERRAGRPEAGRLPHGGRDRRSR